MIQRIQSIYLLLSSLLTGSLFFIPFANIETESSEVFKFIYRGLINGEGETVVPTLALAILLTVATAVSFLNIFLFKKRLLQIRLCGLNIALLLGLTGMTYYLGTQVIAEINGVMGYQITTAFPVIAAILTFFALKAIGKDVALLKSMDRIR
ncbi:MAG: DUF4293 domain-containing protein [Carboxylicivirga sp.]|jgi:hypothetical protein|nr:DUF4293 domain-containing protein [Carboxylicivirga sp.]MCT4647041.1 DUF4293 domain-containing protein [Carboxylicivirga sp.]